MCICVYIVFCLENFIKFDNVFQYLQNKCCLEYSQRDLSALYTHRYSSCCLVLPLHINKSALVLVYARFDFLRLKERGPNIAISSRKSKQNPSYFFFIYLRFVNIRFWPYNVVFIRRDWHACTWYKTWISRSQCSFKTKTSEMEEKQLSFEINSNSSMAGLRNLFIGRHRSWT
jgi:hypothetical protein